MQHHISCHVGLSCHDQEGKRAAPQFLSCWPFVPRPEVQACSTTVPVMLPVMPRPGGQACSTTIPVMLACHATTRRAGVQHHNSCHVGLSCHDQEGMGMPHHNMKISLHYKVSAQLPFPTRHSLEKK